MTESTNDQKTCGTDGFNYCFWAKFIVGIPAVFIVVSIVSSLFSGYPFLQVIAGAAAGIATVWAAMKIDKIPALQKKIVNK